MKPPRPATAKDLSEDREHPAYWVYRGWCMAKSIHYTEVWLPSNVEAFLKQWNESHDSTLN